MSGTQSTGWDWNAIAADVSAFVTAVEPLVGVMAPGASAAIGIGAKIIQGVLAEEPTAMALYDQIVGGTAVTPQQLQQYAADYEASYQKLNADIAAKLAAMGN